MRKLNTALWEAIENSGLKRGYIANCLDCRPAFLAGAVRGEKTLTAAQQTLLAEILGKDVKELFHENASTGTGL